MAPQGPAIVVTQEITLGQLLASSLIAMRFSAPIAQASWMWPNLVHVPGAVRGIEVLLDEPVDVGAKGAAVVERPAGEIRQLT